MEEKTPVGSNAPIEESTEKKTSPAPAGSNSPSAAPIAESAGAVDAASTDTGVESAPAGSSSPSAASIAESADAEETASADEASAAEAVPDEEEDENAQWEAYEREQAEIEESRRKPGKYRWVMKQDDMREAMLALEKAKGRYRMYTIAAYVMCVFALFPAADFILTRSVFSMMGSLCGCGARFLDSRHYQPCRPGRYEADESPGHQVLHRGEKSMACRSVIWSTRLR